MDKWKKIKCLALDVDGVLTDGHIQLGQNKDWIRSFFIRDGMGLVLLKEKGYKLAIITSSTAEDIRLRSQHLAIDHFYEGAKNKQVAFLNLLEKTSLQSDEVAYIGDDIIDLPIFEMCGISFSPADAHPSVKAKADIVTQSSGGNGAVREVCDYLIEKGPL